MVRKGLGIPTVKWSYDQSAVVAVLHLSEVSSTGFSLNCLCLSDALDQIFHSSDAFLAEMRLNFPL